MISARLLPLLCLLLIVQLTGIHLSAQQIDENYNQKIKEYTTDKRFLPSSVLNLVTDPKIPSPEKYFGTIIGAPGVMHRTTEIYNYYKKLAEVSSLISVHQTGTSEEGRAINLVMIGNEDAMKRPEFFKDQFLIRLCNSYAIVAYINLRQLIVHRYRHHHMAALRIAKFNRI